MRIDEATLDLLQGLFLRFARIDGVSLSERRIADEVTGLLRAGGVHVWEDNAGACLNGNAGNLICCPPEFDERSPAIMLSAHLDTVQSTAGLKPVINDGTIRSGGATILGADNRLGLAILTGLLLTVAREKLPHQNFFTVFTVAEEIGLLGAKHLELSKFDLRYGFVFDCSQRPGVYIRECVGAATFRASFLGKSAHSGVAPEQGLNAIALAATALAKIQTGRIDADLTVNLGKISGGVALNVVPELAVAEGEVRSFSQPRLFERLDLIRQNCVDSLPGPGSFRFESQQDFAPYVLTAEMPIVATLERALQTAGLTPAPIRYMGGSDANVWNAKGIPAVNIGIGAQKPHTFEEFVLIEDLIKAAEIAFALVTPE